MEVSELSIFRYYRMASPFDVTEFTAKERNAARKDLLKKIEHYNKKMKKTRDLSFPLSPPTTVSLLHKFLNS